MIFSGGPVIWVLFAMGAVALIVFLERFFELRRSQIDWEDFVKGVINVLESGNDAEALSICEETPVPVARIVATAVHNRHQSARVLRDAVDSAGRAEVGRLERRLAALGIIGEIAPLTGLFGVVAGFVRAVLLVDSEALVSRLALTDAAVKAIWPAAAGLAVAIPVIVMSGVLNVRLDRLVSDLEAAASRITGYLSTKEVRK